MRKMTLRGKRFIKKWADRIFAISMIIALLIISIWILTCELKDEHNINIFKGVIISVSILGLIAGICEYISEKLKINIRREIKSIKAKEWWRY